MCSDDVDDVDDIDFDIDDTSIVDIDVDLCLLTMSTTCPVDIVDIVDIDIQFGPGHAWKE